MEDMEFAFRKELRPSTQIQAKQSMGHKKRGLTGAAL